MNYKHGLASAALLALAASVAAGCGGDDSGGGGSGGGDKQVSIAFEQVVTGVPFAVVQRAGAEAAAKDDGKIDLSIAGPNQIDPAAAQKQATDLLAKRPDGFAVSAFPPDLWTRTTKTIADRTDNQVVAVDIKPSGTPDQLDSSPIKTFVGVNDTQQAETVATQIVELGKLGPDTTGTVLLGQCVPGNSGPLAERTAGFKAVFESKLPKATIKTFDSKGDPTGNANAWRQQVQATPDVVAATGACDQDGSSLAKVKAQTKGDFAVGAMEDPPEVLQGIKDGTVLMASTHRRYLEGYLSVMLLADSLRSGDPMPEGFIDVGLTTITKDNVDEIIKRNSSPEETAAWYKPVLEEALADAKNPKPLADAWQSGL
jgi:ABC-type sugar transport system substrate-binding protein